MNTNLMPTTFGIEFSFVPSLDRESFEIEKLQQERDALLVSDPNYHRKYAELGNKIDRLRNQLIMSTSAAADELRRGARKAIPHAHDDGGCLEVPSPIFKSIDSAIDFWKLISPRARALSFVPRRVDYGPNEAVYYGTGGGHIHLGLNGQRKVDFSKRENALLVRNLMIFSANNPWLGWVFNEFMDDINADALSSSKYILSQLRKPVPKPVPKHKCDDDFYSPCKVCENPKYADLVEYSNDLMGCTNKDYAVNFNECAHKDSTTVEFRFFDAPRSWYQVEEHVRFAMGIYSYCKRLAELGRSIPLKAKNTHYVKKFSSRKIVEREFRKTCKKFGLKWSRYQKYMVNFDDRKEHGRLK